MEDLLDRLCSIGGVEDFDAKRKFLLDGDGDESKGAAKDCAATSSRHGADAESPTAPLRFGVE